jgi:hypothetical protein
MCGALAGSIAPAGSKANEHVTWCLVGELRRPYAAYHITSRPVWPLLMTCLILEVSFESTLSHVQPHSKVYQDAVHIHASIGKLEVGERWIVILSVALAQL